MLTSKSEFTDEPFRCSHLYVHVMWGFAPEIYGQNGLSFLIFSLICFSIVFTFMLFFAVY